MINREKLKFPSGTAAAVTLQGLYSRGTEALAKARALFAAAAVLGLVPLLKDLEILQVRDSEDGLRRGRARHHPPGAVQRLLVDCVALAWCAVLPRDRGAAAHPSRGPTVPSQRLPHQARSRRRARLRRDPDWGLHHRVDGRRWPPRRRLLPRAACARLGVAERCLGRWSAPRTRPADGVEGDRHLDGRAAARLELASSRSAPSGARLDARSPGCPERSLRTRIAARPSARTGPLPPTACGRRTSRYQRAGSLGGLVVSATGNHFHRASLLRDPGSLRDPRGGDDVRRSRSSRAARPARATSRPAVRSARSCSSPTACSSRRARRRTSRPRASPPDETRAPTSSTTSRPATSSARTRGASSWRRRSASSPGPSRTASATCSSN